MTRWLKDPLLHFLLIGAGLFVLYGWQADDVTTRADKIEFSDKDVDRLINLWERKWQRLPTSRELQGLVEQQIREEVLYREALAMGLDKGDMVVRRRMAQKMEFISNDLAALAEPDDTELQAYLDKHSDKFTTPGRISYLQVYLNSNERGDQVDVDAQKLLEELPYANAEHDLSMAGDSFMGGYRFNDETDWQVTRLFGEDFSRQIFQVPVGEWTGPIKSGYGLHLVRVDARTDSQTRSLDQVRDKVRIEWIAEQQRKINDQLYSELRKRYEITIASGAALPQATSNSK